MLAVSWSRVGSQMWASSMLYGMGSNMLAHDGASDVSNIFLGILVESEQYVVDKGAIWGSGLP